MWSLNVLHWTHSRTMRNILSIRVEFLSMGVILFGWSKMCLWINPDTTVTDNASSITTRGQFV